MQKHPRKLGRKKGNERCLLLGIKILYEALVSKTMQYWYMKRQKEQIIKDIQ